MFLTVGCSKPFFHQPGTDLDQTYERTFVTDYNTAWQAVLDAFRNFEKSAQKRQAGLLQTNWIDNTAEKNFADSFGGDITFIKARYRLSVSLAPLTLRGKSAVRVTIMKDQFIQRDLLEGWRHVKSDAVEENAYLYRVGRMIDMKQRLKRIEDEKMRKVLEEGV